MSEELNKDAIEKDVSLVDDNIKLVDDSKQEIDIAKSISPEETNSPLEKAEKMSGIKDVGTNVDAIALATKSEDSDEVIVVTPSFFIEDDDRIKIELDILYDKQKGNLVSISRKGLLDPEDFETLGYSHEWFEFTPPTYEDMTRYRQRCSVFSEEAGRTLVDGTVLRNFYIVWHLKDWSMRKRDGSKVELVHDKTKSSNPNIQSLNDKTITAVYKINPTLLDIVLTLLERDMMQ